MALNLNRRPGGGVSFYRGSEERPFIHITPYFDPRFPDEIMLRIDAPKDVTVLRDELTRRRADQSPPPPPRGGDYNRQRDDRRRDYRDDDWQIEEDRA